MIENYKVEYKGLTFNISGIYTPASKGIYTVIKNEGYVGYPASFDMQIIEWNNVDITNLLDVIGDQYELDEIEELILKIRDENKQK